MSTSEQNHGLSDKDQLFLFSLPIEARRKLQETLNLMIEVLNEPGYNVSVRCLAVARRHNHSPSWVSLRAKFRAFSAEPMDLRALVDRRHIPAPRRNARISTDRPELSHAARNLIQRFKP